MKIRVIGGAVIVIAMCLAGYWFLMMFNRHHPYAPNRPDGVSSEAVYIQGPEGKGRWDWCRFVGGEIRCSITTVGGTVLREGVFISYRGPNPTNPADLKITQKSGDSWIALANGGYLIPASDNEGSKRYLDFMAGDAKSFDK